MAYKSTHVLFLLASLLISMSLVAHYFSPDHNLPSNAPSPSDTNQLLRVHIPGVLRCSAPPRNPPRIELVVAGVNVVLSCDSGKIVITVVVTKGIGFFEIILKKM
ncbi:hypothetical protein PanWU01x14_259290, partial [Parasponia andersonii]